MLNDERILRDQLIRNNIARARDRFKTVISQEKHALLKKSSSDHFDYDSTDSDFDGVLRDVLPKRQKLDYRTSVTCKKTGGFNLKLFDRYIDVTPFNEDSPLYPICREWIKNHPVDTKKPSTEKGCDKKESCRDKESDGMEDKGIYELPAPKPLPYDMFGNPISLRIPGLLTDLKQEEGQIGSIWDYFDGNGSEGNPSMPSPAVLFHAHLDRWNNVKKRWVLAAQADNRRYRRSFEVIDGAYHVTPLTE